MVKEIEQVSNARISLGTTRGQGPKSLILVVGSSLANFLQLGRTTVVGSSLANSLQFVRTKS